MQNEIEKRTKIFETQRARDLAEAKKRRDELLEKSNRYKMNNILAYEN